MKKIIICVFVSLAFLSCQQTQKPKAEVEPTDPKATEI